MRSAAAVALALVLVVTGTERSDASVDGNWVHEGCQRADGTDNAYVLGLLDQYRWSIEITDSVRRTVKSTDLPHWNMMVERIYRMCIPDQATYGQVRDVFCKFLAETPERRHEPAFELFRDAMQKAWPCLK